jgi:D-glycero-alpha-D-manno-heptose 1-phosphate guanylyltransferase
MIRKALVLAGGRGTRLSGVVKDVPKPMADVAGLPFLHYLVLDLKKKGIEEVVLLTGHLHEVIEDFLGTEYHQVKISYQQEFEPRGTGGMIYELSRRWDEELLLINGDTYFDVDVQALAELSRNSNSIAIAVREVEKQDRYGSLEIIKNRIISFREKSYIEKGYINGGIYFLPKGVFDSYNLPFAFSLEVDFFQKMIHSLHIIAFHSKGFFIDIGIPEDYYAAQSQIPRQIVPMFDSSWSLFLDRDGVLNQHIPNDYVRVPDDFLWIDGSAEAVGELRNLFSRIIVVTNQQGIAKNLMSELNLEQIHWKLAEGIEQFGGKLDAIYYCPYLKEMNSPMRKPEIGMAIQAKRDFPEIDFSKSIIVGDMITDMEFGHKAGMFCVNVGNTITKKEALKFENLRAFAKFMLYIKD